MIAIANNHSPRLVIIGDYLFDPGVGLISGPSGAHYVCPHLASVLAILVRNAGQVVNHERLARVQHDEASEEPPALSRHVGRLKQYFRDNAHPPGYIEVVPNRGYRLVAPVYGSTREPVFEERRAQVDAHTEPHPNRLVRLVNEFRKRKVCRAMLIYSLVIWLVFQVSEIVVPALGLPDWVNTLVVVLGILGFPIAAVLSWIFDLTPDGLVRERDDLAAPNDPPRKRRDYAMDFALVGSAVAICTMLIISSYSPGTPEAHADPLIAPPKESAYSGGSGHTQGGAVNRAS